MGLFFDLKNDEGKKILELETRFRSTPYRLVPSLDFSSSVALSVDWEGMQKQIEKFSR